MTWNCGCEVAPPLRYDNGRQVPHNRSCVVSRNCCRRDQCCATGSGLLSIELLIVVLIIGILAGIAVPKLEASKDKAKLAGVLSDVRNAETATAVATNFTASPRT
jgi:hypothetical protein